MEYNSCIYIFYINFYFVTKTNLKVGYIYLNYFYTFSIFLNLSYL